MQRFLSLSLYLTLGSLTCFCLHSSGTVHAQTLTAEEPIPAGDASDSAVREELYAFLEREAELVERQNKIVKTVVRAVGPSVVHIEAEKFSNSGSGGKRQHFEEAGSGIVVDLGGTPRILTNRHVVRDAELKDIHIYLADGRELKATDLRTDPETDIAVLFVDDTNLVPARIGDSDRVEMGDTVLAVGSPFGLSRSVTSGIVSAKGRRDLELGDDVVRFQDFMQTDAAINPGNSGGPLINLRGQVIGVNTAIASNSGGNEGIGFSIPINMAIYIAEQLALHGRVERAFLGVHLDRKFDFAQAQSFGLSRRQGARVTQVTAMSPAAKADLRVDDIVLEFNGVEIEDDAHLINLVSVTRVGSSVPMVIFRDGKKYTLDVEVTSRDTLRDHSSDDGPKSLRQRIEQVAFELDTWEIDALGLQVAVLDKDLAERLSVSGSYSGLLVTAVTPGGPLHGRMKRGEVIDQVGNVAVHSITDFEEAMAACDLNSAVRLRVMDCETAPATARTLTVRPNLPEDQVDPVVSNQR